jgi:tape measure domain-containing protein
MQISKYTVGIGFQVDKRQLKLVDKQMKQFERSVLAMSKRLSTNFGKSFVLPELKVKKFKFDSLSLQRGAQTELNRVGRLLELKIGNVRLDQQKINQQVQNVFQRAANNARINVKTVAGTGGGGNPFGGVQQRLASSFSGGRGFGIGAALPMPSMAGRLGMGLGIAGGAAAGVIGGAAYGVSKTNELRQLTGVREGQRLKLETAVGGSRERRDTFTNNLFSLADRLGITADSQIEGYSRFMKQAQSSGMTAEQGFDLYKNVATATRGNGGDQQSIERQAYALQQTLGVGYLRGEELNQQLADSNPAIKKFIIEAFAERTGKQGTESFLDALSKRQVSVQDVLRGYEKSAKEAAGRVDELSNSIQGAEARLSNMRLSEELERTVQGPLSKAALDYVDAQRKLQESMEPLRDVFYDVAASGTSLAAKFLTWGSDVIKDPLKSVFGDEENTGGATGGWGPSGSTGSWGEEGSASPKATPLKRLPSDWGIPAAMLEGMRSKQDPQTLLALENVSRWNKPPEMSIPPASNSSTNSVTVQPGALVIHTQAANADQLKDELTPHIKQIFEWSLEDAFNSTMIESPYAE